jgi:hypothetical protein
MAQKSILEQALLQVETLEEAVKANAKGILASTMKEELNSLLKEQEDEKDPEEEENDVPELPGDEKSSISGDEEPDNDADDSEELPAETGNELEEPEMEPSDEEDSDDVLDMTGASEAEVMKVFKAMKPEDGIVVKKEGGNVQFSDGDNEYIIKLDAEGEDHESMETPGEEAAEHGDEEAPEFPDGLAEQNEPAEKDEIVYEIELDDDDDDTKETEPTEGENSPFDKKVSGKRVEAKENVSLPTKAPNKSDPFEKDGKSQGAKLRATEVKEQETGVDKWSGTPLKGTSNPVTKEPGKGGSKTTQAEKFEGTPPKGTKPAETKEPGKGGTKTTQAEKFEGTPPKGTGKPVVKEPKEEAEVGKEECKECGNKEMEATEAARTKWNIHGDKGGANRAGIKSKKVFATGGGANMGVVNEELETLRKQNAEYKKALILFKDKLNEVAVFNANLAYATRLFTEHSTTKQEKLNILKRFDSVSIISESKNLYNTIKTELETSKPVTEAVVEKLTSTPTSSASEVLSESKAYENPQFKRMKDLMAKIK